MQLKEAAPANYREALPTLRESRSLRLLLDNLLDAGILMINTCSASMSTQMGEDEIDQLVAAMRCGVEELVLLPPGR